MLNKNLIEINDIYFVSERIKTINKNFKLYFNPQKNQFEIHNLNQHPSFVISYKTYPDSNLIDKLFYTNKENMKNLFFEIEQNNNKLQLSKSNRLLDNSIQQFKEIFDYAFSNPGKNLSSNQIKNILEKGD